MQKSNVYTEHFIREVKPARLLQSKGLATLQLKTMGEKKTPPITCVLVKVQVTHVHTNIVYMQNSACHRLMHSTYQHLHKTNGPEKSR